MFSAFRKSALSTVYNTSNVVSNVFQKGATSAILPLTTVRFASNFSPRRTKYRKAHKGKIPIPTGGSTKGTTVEFGDYGLRVKEGVRLTGRQLTAVHNAIKRKIKPVKGSQLWMRVFPDIPVSSKGNEVRMGKGKGTFEYWACRVPLNRIIFEISGMRKEIAKEAFRLASHKLPIKVEMVERGAKPVVGSGFVAPTVTPIAQEVVSAAAPAASAAAPPAI
ncbi:ribosomal protein L16p/L10e-domain-containing protein [Mucor mucedo]|uniref:ribosomal protein L16p/L10e-domain-containing protein n=1 Tax=Mucor mucedo TaxID=29922 RepID=UPI002220BDE1|nr:ribosomal protein L16p/L10e-domain-containing protein [Mucor mucedo]KAI7895325.1 ribosomal protein L16p/L10e-domain-containing protein [Mucor mucedo]